MAKAVTQADQLQKVQPFFYGSIIIHPGENHGKCNIFKGRHDLNNVKCLKYITNLAAAQPGQLIGVQLGDVNLINKHFTRAGFIQTADHIEQCTFSGAGGSHNGNIIAAGNLEVYPLERLDLNLAELKCLINFADTNNISRFCHNTLL